MKKAKPTQKPEAKTDDVLIEGNRFTPFGALPAKDPDKAIQGTPIKQ